MAALQRLAQSNFTSSSSSYSSSSCLEAEAVVSDQFPAGLRVLVVDDDITCLRILEQMLRRCLYHVTTCSQAIAALELLRENKGCFDVVLSDVYMPDMDGYKLLEHVGLEMDLPVIMMSADGSTSAVLRGVKHGACDYLIKPIREEELKNIWQHVVRKRQNENKLLEHSGSFEDTDRHRRGNDDFEYASSVNEVTEGPLKYQKKRSNSKEEDDGELENDDPSTSKKPRVVWSVELHQQFVNAVNQLGIDKAVPKRILELMNVPGLTRENVASHLQKFRLYLKRISGVAQQAGIPNAFCGPEQNIRIGSLGRFDIQALAASGQIPPQTLAALHAELLGRPIGNLGTATDQSAILQAPLQGPKCVPVERSLSFGQPVVKCHPSISKHFQQSVMPLEDIPLGFGAWPSNNIGTLGPNSTIGALAAQNDNLLMNLFQQQQQKSQPQSTLPESSRSISVQPSCLVAPSRSSSILHSGNNPASVGRNCNTTSSIVIDYSLLSSQSNNPSNVKQVSDGDLNCTGGPNAYSASGSVSSSVSSCSVTVDKGSGRQAQNSNIVFKAARPLPGFVQNSDVQSAFSTTKSGKVLDHGAVWNTAFVGKGAWFPTRLGVDEFQSSLHSSNHGKILAEDTTSKVKQEPVAEYMDNSRVGVPMLPRFPPSDLMSVLTE